MKHKNHDTSEMKIIDTHSPYTLRHQYSDYYNQKLLMDINFTNK